MFQDRVPPVGIFQPVRGRRAAKQLRADFRPQVAGNPQAVHLRQCRGALPTRYAANFHDVRHQQVGGARRDGVSHIERAPPVFTALNRSFSRFRDQGMPAVVVRQRRFLDPGKPLVVEYAQARDRIGWCQALVVVDHDGHLCSGGLAHGANHGHVFRYRCIADLCLDAAKSTCGPTLGNPRTFADAIVADGAVGLQGSLLAAEQLQQRQRVHARQRIPQSHIDCGERDADKPLRSEQAETPAKVLFDCDGCEHLALHQGFQVAHQFRGRQQRGRRVGKHHAVTGHPAIRDDIRQHQRRLGDHAAGRAMRFRHRHAHRAHFDGLYFRYRFCLHAV